MLVRNTSEMMRYAKQLGKKKSILHHIFSRHRSYLMFEHTYMTRYRFLYISQFGSSILINIFAVIFYWGLYDLMPISMEKKSYTLIPARFRLYKGSSQQDFGLRSIVGSSDSDAEKNVGCGTLTPESIIGMESYLALKKMLKKCI